MDVAAGKSAGGGGGGSTRPTGGKTEIGIRENAAQRGWEQMGSKKEGVKGKGGEVGWLPSP